MALDGTDVIQLSLSGDDTGGTIALEKTFDGGITWVPQGAAAWADVYNWGPKELFAGTLLRCWEEGNGIDYAGQSIYSDTFDPS